MTAAGTLRRLAADVAGLFYPPVCHICGCRLGPHEKFLCVPCISALPRTLYHRTSDGMNPMEHRFAGIVPFLRATGHFFYAPSSPLASVIQDFKYRHFPDLAVRMGEILGSELLPSGFLADVDVIVPVPLHFMKKARRGYNQSMKLALGVSSATDIPVSDALQAYRPHRTQTSLSHTQRRSNTEGIFRLRRPGELDGKTVALIDDVCTTGATLTSAAEVVMAGNPSARLVLLSLGVTF